MHSDDNMMTRRRFAAGFAIGSVALALPLPAMALTVDQARGLIDKAIADVNAVINSGKSEAAMFPDQGQVDERVGHLRDLVGQLGGLLRELGPDDGEERHHEHAEHEQDADETGDDRRTQRVATEAGGHVADGLQLQFHRELKILRRSYSAAA